MPTWEIIFMGRRIGSIGMTLEFTARRRALTPQDAIRALYNEFEHIHVIAAREVPARVGER